MKGPDALQVAEVLAALAAALRSAGWDEAGGRLIRDPDTDQVTGRTVWIPRAEWWRDKPADLTERRAAETITRALTGRKLGARQRRHLRFLVDVARSQAGAGGFV